MSIYQIKHKAKGRYGVITPTGEWLADFLDSKEIALQKAEQLNSALSNGANAQMVAPKQETVTKPLAGFALTAKGWLFKGE